MADLSLNWVDLELSLTLITYNFKPESEWVGFCCNPATIVWQLVVTRLNKIYSIYAINYWQIQLSRHTNSGLGFEHCQPCFSLFFFIFLFPKLGFESLIWISVKTIVTVKEGQNQSKGWEFRRSHGWWEMKIWLNLEWSMIHKAF